MTQQAVRVPLYVGRFVGWILCCLLIGSSSVQADQFDDLRLKWFDSIVGAGYDQ